MSRLILLAILIIVLALAFFAFNVFFKAARYCWSYNEAECQTKLVCKPFYEYGVSCGEDGCKEGERFKECKTRF